MNRTPQLAPSPPSAGPDAVWHDLPQPRVAPVPKAQQTWLLRGLLYLIHSNKRAAVGGERPEPLHVFTTLAHDRGLFYRWLLFASRLMPFGKLPRTDTERIILRVGFCTGSWYEWAQHVRIGRDAGLSDDEIQDLQLDDAPGWSARTRTLMRAVDALIRQHHLDDALWRELRTQLSDKQCIEFCLLVGHYVMLAMTLNTLGVAVEPHNQIPR